MRVLRRPLNRLDELGRGRADVGPRFDHRLPDDQPLLVGEYDTYRMKYWVGMPDAVAPTSLPADKEKLLASIRANTKTSGGCWDVFVWRGDQILFLELKRKKRDAIKDTQRRWIDAVLGIQMDAVGFALVEWEYS